MIRKAGFGIMLTLLLTSMLTLVRANTGGRIDVYTQYPYPHGGQGPNEPSDPFAPQDEVILFAFVTYNLWPVEGKFVAFKISDPTGETFDLVTAVTDKDGVASISFRIPRPDQDVLGSWSVLGTVDIGDEVYTDTLTFEVILDITPPWITIHSPQNMTYTTSSVLLIFTIDETWSWIGYSLDNLANVTIIGNTTLTDLAEGSHSIAVYANDTYGNMGTSDKIFFTISLIAEYTLTIDSSPTGVALTVDDESHTTAWEDKFFEDNIVEVSMPEVHIIGDARYYWEHWSDGNTSRSRTIIMTANVTLTAHYSGPYYELTVTSPITGITFTVNGTPQTTSYTEWLLTGSYTLEMPETHVVGEAKYYWDQWSDGGTSRTRTVIMTTNITLTGYYTGPYYELTVDSSPITGVTFTIDGAPQTTPCTEWLPEGSYTLEMPETYDGYVWSHWLEDGDTNRTKIITLSGYATWTGIFVLLSDLNNDGKVDIKDIAIAALAVGSYPGHPRWNPLADVNKDGKVDIRDLALIAKNFGNH